MKLKLKPVGEQVIVITGADSGIGLATARAASQAGAAVVLGSRNAGALKKVAAELAAAGGRVAWHAGDVADGSAMEELARTAVKAFGRIDTWVNNAGVSIYGEIEKVPVDDARRLFETNYFGMVNGALAALPHLRRGGGALINVGSVLSGVAMALQGHYTASKHAVKGFTDSLRQELRHEGAPVSVTLIRPAGIDTPYTEHAHNHMADAEPTLPPPVYAPHVVASAILDCAEHPQREVLVGGGAKQMEMMHDTAEPLYDRYVESLVWDEQRAPRGSKRRRDGLRRAAGSGGERGDYGGHVMENSAYTAAVQHPLKPVLTLGLLGAGVWWLNRTGLLDRWNEELRTRLFGPGETASAALGRETAAGGNDVRGVYEPEMVGAGQS
jgi:short-subunit dehydrogenase